MFWSTEFIPERVPYMDKKEIARECRFVVHIPSRSSDTHDVHLIKEQVHYDDGSIVPNIRFIKDYKRPYWVTKPAYRVHVQRKEWENLDKLMCKQVTQSNLIYDAARLLNVPFVKNPRELFANPYLYGADIESSTFIKRDYSVKYPGVVTPSTVSTLDIETDVLSEEKDIILCTVTFKNHIYTVINKPFVDRIGNFTERLNTKIKEYIGEYVDKANLDIVVEVAEDPVELIKKTFDKLHEWKPDVLAIWNINFDIPYILKQLEKYKADPKMYLCDPIVPYQYRICRYKEGPTKKVTASGQQKPLNPALQWHTLELTASFYVLDAMCVYKRLRMAKQEEPSYALNAILDKELGIRKLSFTEAEQYSGLKWHQVMQQDFKLEYIVYNIFDAYSMQELENKTKDLSFSMPSLASNTPFAKFSSQPKLIADAFFFFLLEKGKVLGTAGKSRKVDPSTNEELDSESPDDDDEEIDEDDLAERLSLKNWINYRSLH